MFKRSKISESKLKIAITGPSGSGKTWSAISVASGMCEALGGGVPCLADSENFSSSMYSRQFTFDSCSISAPYDTEKFIAIINEAERASYRVLIIDSLSAQWTEMLNLKSRMDARNPARSFHNWSELTPKHEALKAKLVSANIHIIATMRSKTEYVMAQENGRIKGINKVGLAPIQRDQIEYEFSTVFDMAMDHSAIASKDRTGMFSTTKPFVPTKETGIQFIRWLNEAESKT